MNKNSFNTKTFVVIIIVLAAIFIWDFLSIDHSVYEKEEMYLQSLNLELSGTVMEIKDLNYSHNTGIITVDIIRSSTRELDERETRSRYFGVIKDNRGYFVFKTIADFEVGDSIVVHLDTYDLYRMNKKIVSKKKITLPYDKVFKPYDEVNRKLEGI